jgi:hypothetical protein
MLHLANIESAALESARGGKILVNAQTFKRGVFVEPAADVNAQNE